MEIPSKNGRLGKHFAVPSARGDKEVPGVDFDIMDTFSPVVRMTSFRMLVALCKILKLLAFLCDINTAYLNARRKVVRLIRHIAEFPLKSGWVLQSNECTIRST